MEEYKKLFNEYSNLYKKLIESETDPNVVAKPSALKQKYPELMEVYKRLVPVYIRLFHEVPKTF